MTTSKDFQPSLQEFMDTLFPPDLVRDGEAPLLFEAIEDMQNPGRMLFPATVWRGEDTPGGEYTHTCISTFGPERNESGRRRRTRDNVTDVWMLQLDDVGTKSLMPKVKPSISIRTREGNWTWIYLFETPIGVVEYEVLSHSLKAAGYGDENCVDAVRLFRLPGSQPPGKPELAAIEIWDPTLTFVASELLGLFEVAEVAPPQHYGGRDPVPAPAGVDVVDEVFEWMKDRGMVRGEDTGGWWHIDCPWEHLHSDRRVGAKYKPASAEDLQRIYHCHHTHGQSAGEWGEAHDTQAFLRWVAEAGGPRCKSLAHVQGGGLQALGDLFRRMGVDVQKEREGLQRLAQRVQTPEQAAAERQREEADETVAWMLERLALDGPTNKVRDLLAPKYPPAVRQAYYDSSTMVPSTTPTGRPTRKMAIDVWAAHPERKVSVIPPRVDPTTRERWVPLPEIGETCGYVNSYEPFEPLPIDEIDPADIEPFLTLMGHVFPHDVERVLDWYAAKLQAPWRRMVALVSVTPTQGTGRNTAMDILRTLLGRDNTTSPPASRVFGGASNQFNAYMSKLLVTISEVDEGAAGADKTVSRGVYTKLKALVDPNEDNVTVEAKGVDPVEVPCYTSFLIATNAGAGLPLDEGDRRFEVLEGNRVPLADAHPELPAWIASVKREGEVADPARWRKRLSAVWHFLMARDVSGAQLDRPRVTEMKRRMTEDAKHDLTVSIEDALDGHAVITQAVLEQRLRARPEVALIYDNGELRRHLSWWMRAHTQRPHWVENQNGQVMLRAGSSAPVRPRVLNSHAHEPEGVQRAHLARFLGIVEGEDAVITPFRPKPEEE